MSFHYRYRKQIIIVCLVLLFLGFFTYIGVDKYLKNKKEIEDTNLIIPKKNIEYDDKEKTSDKYLLVDIKGEVNTPGIYELVDGSRVIDVINKANGLTENANTSIINLSKKIKDEMVIIIYSNQEVEDFLKTKEIENKKIESCIQPDQNSLINDACIDSSENTELTLKVSINNASIEDLMTLPGIGEAKAKSIIEYRDANGGFKAIEEIQNVSGIGENVFAKIKEFITI